MEDVLVRCDLCLLDGVTGVILLEWDVVLTEDSEIGMFGARGDVPEVGSEITV